MKSKIVYLYTFFALLLVACSNGQTPGTNNTNLSASEFSEKLKQEKNAQLIDVRTPEEFNEGFIAEALNINWNSNSFDNDIQILDKSKPVFVYCFSGARSASAASYMRKNGFKEVYELNGGILKWRAAKLPETTVKTANQNEMSLKEFQQLIADNKAILINYYAEWCVPCKKMKPFIDELSTELKGKIEIVRIDVDKNKKLAKELNVTEVPVLEFYKNSNKTWTHSGFIEKKEIEKNILR
ncbi:MAG: redoxin domain-containing protein [Flavobacteriales bacterium]|nr:redoxin domain-containing protein [Flavobacteriales bacterium]